MLGPICVIPITQTLMSLLRTRTVKIWGIHRRDGTGGTSLLSCKERIIFKHWKNSLAQMVLPLRPVLMTQ